MSPSYCPTLGTIFYNGDSLCFLRSQEKVDVQEKKVFGYLLSPHRIYQQAVADGTAINDQSFSTVMLYMYQLADHCGVGYNDFMRVYPKRNGGAPVYCIVVASNLSDETKVPRTDIAEKAKAF